MRHLYKAWGQFGIGTFMPSIRPWGAAIPGLAMNASEIPSAPGLVALQNPEVGDAPRFSRPYTLEDVAELHARTLSEFRWDSGCTPVIIGMSMGGMIAAILATTYRHLLPQQCYFRFLVTSANSPELPAVPDSLLEHWRTATPGVEDDFRRVLTPFFSSRFTHQYPHQVDAYIRYRAQGRNEQDPRAFMRQLSALRSFDGNRYFSAIRPNECRIISGAGDGILGPRHHEVLGRLSPSTPATLLADVGHMINLESPASFKP